MNYRKCTKKELLGHLEHLMSKETEVCILSAESFFNYVRKAKKVIGLWDKEHSVVLCLNAKNIVIKTEVISVGMLTATLVHPREVFKAAVLASAKSIIFVHNHPSGDLSPSPSDDATTRRLRLAGETMEIPLLDHIIVVEKGLKYYSYSDQGRMYV